MMVDGATVVIVGAGYPGKRRIYERMAALGARLVILDAIEPCDEREVLPDGQIVEQARLVRKECQLTLCRNGFPGDIGSADSNRAARGGNDSSQTPQRGGLSRSIRPHQPQHLAGCHRE